MHTEGIKAFHITTIFLLYNESPLTFYLAAMDYKHEVIEQVTILALYFYHVTLPAVSHRNPSHKLENMLFTH